MKRQDKKNMKDAIGNHPEINSWENPDYDNLFSYEDSALFDSFGYYMKGRLDLDEVRSDPSLHEIEKDVKAMISDYNLNRSKRTVDGKFIREIFDGPINDENIAEDIEKIRLEINENNINELASGWIKEWDEKKSKDGGKDSKTEKLIEYVSGSLGSEVCEPELKLNISEPLRGTRSTMIRYLSFSAAAIIGAFILIKTLLPVSDPGKLYDTYYEPFNVISSVTRDAGSGTTDNFAAALESYKKENYQAAVTGFSKLIYSGNEVIPSQFFLGITEMALENFDESIGLLSSVANGSGEYRKEAVWYLGLAYLRNGEKDKAAGCFDQLAQSMGFYSERSEKILRRLR